MARGEKYAPRNQLPPDRLPYEKPPRLHAITPRTIGKPAPYSGPGSKASGHTRGGATRHIPPLAGPLRHLDHEDH